MAPIGRSWRADEALRAYQSPTVRHTYRDQYEEDVLPTVNSTNARGGKAMLPTVLCGASNV